MPIEVTLDRVMKERGVTLSELSARVGITLANLSILKTNKAKAVRFSTLEALCHELDCQPGELIQWLIGDRASARLQSRRGFLARIFHRRDSERVYGVRFWVRWLRNGVSSARVDV